MSRRSSRSVGACSCVGSVSGGSVAGGGGNGCGVVAGNVGNACSSSGNGGGGTPSSGTGGNGNCTSRSGTSREAAREASEQKMAMEAVSGESFQSLAQALTQMQETMQSMNLRMKKTDQAVRGVGQRLNLHGRIMQKIQKRMNVLENTLQHTVEREHGVCCAPFPAEGTRPQGFPDSACQPFLIGGFSSATTTFRAPYAHARPAGIPRSVSCTGPGSPAVPRLQFRGRPAAQRSLSCGGATNGPGRSVSSCRGRISAAAGASPRSASFVHASNRAFSPGPGRTGGLSRSLSCTTGVPTPSGPHRVPLARMRTASVQRSASSTGTNFTDVRFSSPSPNRSFFPRSVSSTGSLYMRSPSNSAVRPAAVPRSVSFTGPAYVPGRSPSMSHTRVPPAFRSPSSSNATVQQSPSSTNQASRLISLGKNLLNAAQEGRTAAVRNLLDAGANPNFTYGSEWTPLHRAAAKSHADVVSLLLKRGADVTARTSGFTALHMAAYYDLSGRCVTMLIDAGSDLNTGNQFWRTPLHYAAEAGNDSAVRALVAAGAKKNPKDNEGKTPLDVAKTHCVRRLLALYCNRT